MARYYSLKQMQEVLHALGILPVDGTITTTEAAAILTWRAKEEHQVDFLYTNNHVIARVMSHTLEPMQAQGKKGQKKLGNRYRVEDIFSLPIYPRKQKQARSEAA